MGFHAPARCPRLAWDPFTLISDFQSLESYQLDDLPADGSTVGMVQQQGKDSRPHFNLSRLKRDSIVVNSRAFDGDSFPAQIHSISRPGNKLRNTLGRDTFCPTPARVTLAAFT